VPACARTAAWPKKNDAQTGGSQRRLALRTSVLPVQGVFQQPDKRKLDDHESDHHRRQDRQNHGIPVRPRLLRQPLPGLPFRAAGLAHFRSPQAASGTSGEARRKPGAFPAVLRAVNASLQDIIPAMSADVTHARSRNGARTGGHRLRPASPGLRISAVPRARGPATQAATARHGMLRSRPPA